MAQFKSKHGIVSRPQQELYMSFVDMRNFTQMIPEDKKDMITADYDSLTATVQNFRISVKVSGRVPYSLIQLQDADAPFHFGISIHFDESPVPGKTDFHIDVDADLNLMMKMMLGNKIEEALNRIVDGLVAVSEGRMPEGMPKDFNFN